MQNKVNKNFVVARMEKIKQGNLGGLSIHNDRKTENHSNKDIDVSKSNLNFDLISQEKGISYKKKINTYIENKRVSDKKVRKDAVVLAEWVISASSNVFKNMENSEIRRYFQESVNYFREKFGKDNIMYGAVHFDETTPHMHMGIVPMTDDGRLSSKDVFSRNILREVQNELAIHLQKKGFSVVRGKKDSKRKNLSVSEYKKMQDELVEMQKKEEKAKKNWENLKKKRLNTKKDLMEFIATQAIDVFSKEEYEELTLTDYLDKDKKKYKLSSKKERQIYAEKVSFATLVKTYKQVLDVDQEKKKEKLKKEREELIKKEQQIQADSEHYVQTIKAVLSKNNVIAREDEPVYYFDKYRKPVFLGSVKEVSEMENKEIEDKVIPKDKSDKQKKGFITRMKDFFENTKMRLADYLKNRSDEKIFGYISPKTGKYLERIFINPTKRDLMGGDIELQDLLKDFNPVKEGKKVAQSYLNKLSKTKGPKM